MGVDARVTIDDTAWEVEPDMAGETVILLWGLFDEEMYVEFTGGPYYPVSGPVPLHSYRTFRRGKAAERADRIHALARQLNIPISALSGSDLRVVSDDTQQRIDELPHQPFNTRNLNTTFPPLLRQNWQLPTIWPECRMKTGRLIGPRYVANLLSNIYYLFFICYLHRPICNSGINYHLVINFAQFRTYVTH